MCRMASDQEWYTLHDVVVPRTRRMKETQKIIHHVIGRTRLLKMLLLRIGSRCCLQHGAMKRALAPVVSSSSGKAARPATTAAPSSSGSAAQPVTTAAPGSCGRSARRGTSTTSSTQPGITTLNGVQLWLAEDQMASCTSAEAQRIREAVAVLSHPKPRQEDVRPLQTEWQAAQKK